MSIDTLRRVLASPAGEAIVDPADRDELLRLVAAEPGEPSALRTDRNRIRALAGQACEVAHRLAGCLEANSDKASRRGWAAGGRAEIESISAMIDAGSAHPWFAVFFYFVTDAARVHLHHLRNAAQAAVDQVIEREGLGDGVRVEIDAGEPPPVIEARELVTDEDVLQLAAEMNGARP